jgi:O-acetylserine/cysteine efflux transporter
LLGMATWCYLLQKYPVNMVSPFALLAPVFGIFFSHYVFDTFITARLIIGAFIAVLGQMVLIWGHKLRQGG